MEVILRKDVAGLGKAGQTVKVKDGYARNYLLPRGIAVPVTKGSLREQESLAMAQKDKEERLLKEAQRQKDILDGKTLVFYAKAGKGRIFGSVTSQEIAAKISSTYKIPLDKRRVLLEENLKELGTHQAEIQLHSKVRAKITIEIRPMEEGK